MSDQAVNAGGVENPTADGDSVIRIHVNGSRYDLTQLYISEVVARRLEIIHNSDEDLVIDGSDISELSVELRGEGSVIANSEVDTAELINNGTGEIHLDTVYTALTRSGNNVDRIFVENDLSSDDEDTDEEDDD